MNASSLMLWQMPWQPPRATSSVTMRMQVSSRTSAISLYSSSVTPAHTVRTTASLSPASPRPCSRTLRNQSRNLLSSHLTCAGSASQLLLHLLRACLPPKLTVCHLTRVNLVPSPPAGSLCPYSSCLGACAAVKASLCCLLLSSGLAGSSVARLLWSALCRRPSLCPGGRCPRLRSGGYGSRLCQ